MDSVTITASATTYTSPINIGDRVRGNIGVQVRLVSGTESTGLNYTYQQAMDYDSNLKEPTNWVTPSGGGTIGLNVTGGRNLFTLSQDAAPFLRIGVEEQDGASDNVVEIKIWGV